MIRPYALLSLLALAVSCGQIIGEDFQGYQSRACGSSKTCGGAGGTTGNHHEPGMAPGNTDASVSGWDGSIPDGGRRPVHQIGDARSGASSSGHPSGDTGDAGDAGDADAGDADAAVVPPRHCNPDAPFRDVVALSTLNTTYPEDAIWIMPDDMTAYFSSNRTPGTGNFDIYRATRPDPFSDFENVHLLEDPVNTSTSEQSPSLSADGLTLYFYSYNGAESTWDIFVSKRESPSAAFPLGHAVSGINSEKVDGDPFLTTDGKELYFASNRLNGFDIYVSRVDAAGTVLEPRMLALSGPNDEQAPVLTNDGLEMYFGLTDKNQGNIGGDIWLASRARSTDDFDMAGPVLNVNSDQVDYPKALSPDGCTLYFVSNRNSHYGLNLYKATKP